jgi:hypothetical protein
MSSSMLPAPTISWTAWLEQSKLTLTNGSPLYLQFFCVSLLQSSPVLVHLGFEIMEDILSGVSIAVDIKPDHGV